MHRGVHELSEIASEAYESARRKVAAFFNAPHERQIVFTRNATESINLVAHAFGRTHVGAGDEVLISAMEHHSNIVPWQLLCEERGGRLRVAPMNDRGELMLDEFEALVGERTKLVAVTHMSNALGTINPVEDIIRIAHRRGVPVLVDGSQAAYHMPVDVQALDCDFYAATGHKLYGPTGMGILYGKESHLESMPPFLGGGDDPVGDVSRSRRGTPAHVRGGTPISGAISFGGRSTTSVDGLPQIAEHERSCSPGTGAAAPTACLLAPPAAASIRPSSTRSRARRRDDRRQEGARCGLASLHSRS